MYYLSNICSFCLIANQNLTNILSQDIDGKVIIEKLNIFPMELLININLKPNIPKFICKNCLERVNNIHKFILSCLKSVRTLNEYARKLEPYGQYKEMSVTLLTHRRYGNADVEVFVKKEIEDTQSAYNKNRDKNISKNIQGVFIKTEMEDELDSLDFVKEEHKNKINSQEPCAVFTKNNVQNPVRSSSNISNKRIKTKVINQCEDCMKSFPCQNHAKLSSLEPKYYKCTTCQKVFKQHSNQPTTHKCKYPIEKHAFECSVCNCVFASKQYLNIHMRKHTGEKPYECNSCELAFHTAATLATHKRVHSNIRAHICPVCNMLFKSLASLNRHKRIHTGDILYTCDFCEKTYCHYTSLMLHKKKHVGVRPFNCSVCSKGFANKYSLNRHLRLHTRDKLYQCYMCPYNSIHSNNFKLHVQTHLKSLNLTV